MMESLEDSLQEVRDLGSDLFSTVVIQEPEWRQEKVYSYGRLRYRDDEEDDSYFGYSDTGTTSAVKTKDRITKPDTERRITAWNQLHQIVDSSESCGVRYIARRAIGHKIDHDNANQLPLEEWKKQRELQYNEFMGWVIQDLKKSKKEDIEKLYNYLTQWGPLDRVGEQTRKEAGKRLGYSEGFIIGDAISTSQYSIEELGNVVREGRNEDIRKKAEVKLKERLYDASKSEREEIREKLGYSKSQVRSVIIFEYIRRIGNFLIRK